MQRKLLLEQVSGEITRSVVNKYDHSLSLCGMYFVLWKQKIGS